MPSPRNSRFTENFDDSSESPSPESNSTASSPEFTPRSNSPTQLTQKFSTMSLKDTNPRGAHHHNGVTSQPQSPAQEHMSTKTQTPDVAQHSQSDAVEMLSAKSIITLAEYLIPSLRLGADKTSKLPSTEADPTETQVNDQEHPTLDDENLPEEPNASVDGQSEAESEMSRSSSFSNQDLKQEEPINPARQKSIEFVKTAVDEYFDDIQTEQNIHPKTLTESFNRLVHDLQFFRKHRDATARKFQKCYSSHSGTKLSPADCDDCFMYMTQIENGYYDACAKIRSMMIQLRKGIWASIMQANFHREIEKGKGASTLGGMEVHDVNLQRLEETKCMLQSLEDDAEAAKGWPQVSSSDVPPEDGQAAKKTKEGEDARTDGTKSSPVKGKKGKSKEQKKKKKGKR